LLFLGFGRFPFWFVLGFLGLATTTGSSITATSGVEGAGGFNSGSTLYGASGCGASLFGNNF